MTILILKAKQISKFHNKFQNYQFKKSKKLQQKT